ncbi:unnamed protein product (mitochondrion) [Plasmodiophora brassicae]|uniref:Uncharacterized protein n=1 Tax=Plasmodiophora brassicae TaxID=37360 RepID=A0A3P3YH37_PLABS|nr:unnamed protein product [Plasmodiophora brassicae]
MTTGTIDLNVANMALQRRVRCFKPAALTLSLTFLLIGLCNGIEYVFVADVATGYVECGEAIDEDRVCLHGAQDLVRTAGFRPHEQEGSCFYCYVGNVVPEDLTLLRDFMALVNPDIDWVPDAKNFVNNYNLRERHFEYNYRLLELAHRYNMHLPYAVSHCLTTSVPSAYNRARGLTISQSYRAAISTIWTVSSAGLKKDNALAQSAEKT